MPEDPDPPVAPVARVAARVAAQALLADEARVAAARRLQPAATTATGRARGAGQSAWPALDRLAGLAARLLGTPAAQVSLLSDVQTVPAAAGLDPQAHAGAGPLADSLCTVTAAGGGPLVVSDAATDERVAGLPPVTSGAVGAYLGVPLTGQDGHVVGALCVFDPAPRTWNATDVALLSDLATAVASELELSALSVDYEAARQRWQLSITAAGIGSFDWDLLTGELVWDERLIELFGYGGDVDGSDGPVVFDRSIEAFNARLHPEDVPRVSQALTECISTCGDFEAEYRVVRPDGSTRWVQARGTALAGEDGTAVRLLGAAYDTTAQREADVRIARVLESMSSAFYSLDVDWRFTYVNAEAERLLQRPREELLGGDIWDLFPGAVGAAFDTEYHRAVETGQAVTFEAYYPPPLDGWYEIRAWPGPDGLSVYFVDVTARKHAQQAAETARQAAENANARLALLATTSRQMAETLEAEAAVTALAQLVVPALGDWCLVSVLDDETSAGPPTSARATARRERRRRDQPRGQRRGLRDAGSWHRDARARDLVRRYAERRLVELDDSAFLWRALREEQPVFIDDATAALTALLDPAGEGRALLAQLAPAAGVIFPLRGRGRTVGLLSLFIDAGRERWSEEELATIAEVADRAGLALDSARLYRQQRDLAAAFQRSLLTAPPEPDHGQIVVRYTPAAEAAQVGGDWYDAFMQPDGATVLVIGDVIGHDTEAAAAMSQVRTIVRTLGALGEESPASILAGTDRAMANLQLTTTATAIAARLEQDLDERERGVTRLRWSNAGHPPAMVVNPDGTVTPLLGLHPDLLLGVVPGTGRRDTEVVLGRGATVLLYTDGLVERRDQPLQEGLEKLQAVLEDLAAQDGDLDGLVDQVLARMLPPDPEDDVAVIAVRLHRQDRARPAEAGPGRVPPHVPPEPEPPR
ncbi:SpoIIE family protein phosphatase [Kineococcus radiotolerans]|uniref:PAS/PAC sensor protein n=1 Tax=Kineococcus radiotolerans (strain ATCC BAA-149 / DSM 14245 / SRS30216) TaxID=266940 RepID=A6W9M1_KINRD|nr:SpoIIE family protein phosphatase [Kineococcus radiotolerans]ABS03510.1 putative PAS/PAC sensor protein [Kineococcus radiotolerans SRS30216 = ATCC BAA-149]